MTTGEMDVEENVSYDQPLDMDVQEHVLMLTLTLTPSNPSLTVDIRHQIKRSFMPRHELVPLEEKMIVGGLFQTGKNELQNCLISCV